MTTGLPKRFGRCYAKLASEKLDRILRDDAKRRSVEQNERHRGERSMEARNTQFSD